MHAMASNTSTSPGPGSWRYRQVVNLRDAALDLQRAAEQRLSGTTPDQGEINALKRIRDLVASLDARVQQLHSTLSDLP